VTELPASAASFDWFWQPPLAGDPGIIMIRDTHPGPEATAVPMIGEDMNNVLLTVESRIPNDVHLYQLRIYLADIFGVWIQVEFNVLGRSFKLKEPDFSQADLSMVWDNHESRAGRAT